jgi:hypothetical protein
MRKLGITAFSLLVALSIVAPAPRAWAASPGTGGDGALSGPGKVRVTPSCRTAKFMFAGTWHIDGAGEWTWSRPGQPQLSGVVIAETANGLISLSLDAQSQTVFDQMLASLAGDACGGPVSVLGSSSIARLDLLLDKSHTRAKVSLLASASVASAKGNGAATLKAFARGAWVDPCYGCWDY